MILLMGGCSTRGVAEFELYRSTTLQASAASTAILDQLALQERALFFQDSRKRDALQFDPDLARYYTDAVDPPATRAFRNAFQTVVIYNDLLYGLSSGQTADTLVAKVQAMNSSLSKAAVDTAALTGPGHPAEAAAMGAALNAAFSQVKPFLLVALKARSRERFRYYVVAYYPAVRAILVALRSSTKDMFLVLNAPTLNRIRASPTAGTPDDRQRVVAYRKLLADWIILIDASIDALASAKRAAEAPASALDAVEGIAAASSELGAASQAARRDLAELAAN
ncbi:hypothetical protein [Candidatus Phyllobacterium onerii]|uniref:hypothetical protein n=1 Tax=Candidatus Phyllobacterium onerii TaxID=3020828 RepID=UPI00232FB78E|nr:hypothetical protein [Phyllobacterium sp. IY22]